jgi:hypothetical protein
LNNAYQNLWFAMVKMLMSYRHWVCRRWNRELARAPKDVKREVLVHQGAAVLQVGRISVMPTLELEASYTVYPSAFSHPNEREPIQLERRTPFWTVDTPAVCAGLVGVQFEVRPESQAASDLPLMPGFSCAPKNVDSFERITPRAKEVIIKLSRLGGLRVIMVIGGKLHILISRRATNLASASQLAAAAEELLRAVESA